jgi:hypothetical protein
MWSEGRVDNGGCRKDGEKRAGSKPQPQQAEWIAISSSLKYIKIK